MGKINSTFSFTGKVGEAVGMKGMNGETYVRKNFIPANPKTTSQVDQRVKMSLAGMLSKITPSSLIVGLGSSKRNRRSMFTSNIARNAEVTSNVKDGEKTTLAKLDPSKLIFSDGIFKPVPALTTSYDGKNLTVTAQTAPADDVSAILVIGVFADLDNGTYISVNGGIVTNTDPINIPGEGSSVNVYTVPLAQAEGESNVTYQRIIDRIAENPYDYAAAAQARESGNLLYAGSKFVSTVNKA